MGQARTGPGNPELASMRLMLHCILRAAERMEDEREVLVLLVAQEDSEELDR
jgi:hypothetical protein